MKMETEFTAREAFENEEAGGEMRVRLSCDEKHRGLVYFEYFGEKTMVRLVFDIDDLELAMKNVSNSVARLEAYAP